MRVITGSARGRVLLPVAGMDVRPTTDKVKEAVFSAIQFEVEGARVLDLFCGSGQMGIEALSRGAQSCVFVDSSRASQDVTKKNLTTTGLMKQARVAAMDYQMFLKSSKDTFDLVFLDPPYRMQEAYGNAMAQMQQRNLLAPDARIVAEMAAGASVPLPSGFCTLDERKYGDTKLVFVGRQE